MAEFKCICCGHIKESKTECTCPECGYKMFETPYDRKNVLRKEITFFLSQLRLTKIKDWSLDYYRFELVESEDSEEKEKKEISKSQDDKRFPKFSKIQEYACSAQKTELFLERLAATLEHISQHIHSSFQQVYEADTNRIKEEIKEYDEVLNDALDVLNLNVEISELKIPKFTLDYAEMPDKELLPIAETLLLTLNKLLEKIKKFVKQNNVYGESYKNKGRKQFNPEENADYIKELEQVNLFINNTISKNFFVDIFSDGTQELHEMLSAFWYGVYALLDSPVLSKTYRYQFTDGTSVYDESFEPALLLKINTRYESLDNLLSNDSFLTEASESSLFENYNKMIELDEYGIIGLDESALKVAGKSEKQLNDLIGLDSIKNSVKKIKAYAVSNKNANDLNLHMCFYGNPGTGKTEVARIIAGILYENNILPTNNVVEVDRSGLIGQYLGETPQKTMAKIEEAMGGVLFVDEAYALVPKNGGRDYGEEAIATLIKAMEDYRGKFCVILAGYKNQMNEMIASNPGFKSRIQFELDFPNYSRDEIKKIAKLMLRKRHYSMSDQALEKALDVTDLKRKEANFANAREIRNVLDQVIMCQNLRCVGESNKNIEIVDVNRYIKDSGINLPVSEDDSSKKILTGSEELEQLIGLNNIKRTVKKIRAYAKKNKNETNFNLHMCFYGNPGTGKTEVARILSRILYEADALPEAKMIETDAHGLIGRYVGETAPKTLEKVQDAMGGVLFIDEAYALTMGNSKSSGNYGEEAVATLLKAMEDYRGQFCTVFAGYKKEMQTLLDSNPGLQSRIQFTLEFPDYSTEELKEIALLFLKKKKYSIDDNALELLLKVVEYYRSEPNYANARTLRNVLDQVIMNQNLRTEDEDENYQITIDDVEDYIAEENINFSGSGNQHGRIGFI